MLWVRSRVGLQEFKSAGAERVEVGDLEEGIGKAFDHGLVFIE